MDRTGVRQDQQRHGTVRLDLQLALIFLIHVALAFHLVHHWSHQHAWDHTQQISGYGDGLYLNYAVVVVWTLDVMWWWLRPGSYLQRPRWLVWAVHGLLLFVCG